MPTVSGKAETTALGGATASLGEAAVLAGGRRHYAVSRALHAMLDEVLLTEPVESAVDIDGGAASGFGPGLLEGL